MGLMKTIRGEKNSKHYKQFIKAAKSMCTKNVVEFRDVIKYGEEGRTIVLFAYKNNIDLIVIGSRGMGNLREVFLGSTSNYVSIHPIEGYFLDKVQTMIMMTYMIG